jgi:hypothetical protein
MRSELLATLLLALAEPVRADEKLAEAFRRAHPENKGFDPAAAAIRAEVRGLTSTEAKHLLAKVRDDAAEHKPLRSKFLRSSHLPFAISSALFFCRRLGKSGQCRVNRFATRSSIA